MNRNAIIGGLALALLSAPSIAQVQSLPRDGDFVGMLGDGSPRLNGEPYICKSAPLPGSTYVKAGGDFPLRMQVFAGETCGGPPLLSVLAPAGEVAWVQVDAGLSYRRSVAFSSPSPTGMGIFVAIASFETFKVTGEPTGGIVRPQVTMGTLAQPLPPVAIEDTDGMISNDRSCRAVYEAWAENPGGFTARLTRRQPDEYRRRAEQTPSPAGDDERLLTQISRSLYATHVLTLDDEADDVVRLAHACDLRFGFTPLTLGD